MIQTSSQQMNQYLVNDDDYDLDEIIPICTKFTDLCLSETHYNDSVLKKLSMEKDTTKLNGASLGASTQREILNLQRKIINTEKFGTKRNYLSNSRTDTKSLSGHISNHFLMFLDCVQRTYSSKTVNSQTFSKIRNEFINQIRQHGIYDAYSQLKKFANMSDEKYVIFTHPNKNSYGKIKIVKNIKPYHSNENLEMNAFVVNMDGVRRFFEIVKEEWLVIQTNFTNTKTKRFRVENLVNQERKLKAQVKSMEKNASNLESHAKFFLDDDCSDKMEIFALYQQRNYFANPDMQSSMDDFIDRWDEITKIAYYVESILGRVRYLGNEVMKNNEIKEDLIESLKINETRNFIRTGTKVENPSTYNSESQSYDLHTLETLPIRENFVNLIIEYETAKIEARGTWNIIRPILERNICGYSWLENKSKRFLSGNELKDFRVK
tara:strand:- start:1112 stop:2419 length:1308 start_codon:yes stop_codon:yes gene_type:complete